MATYLDQQQLQLDDSYGYDPAQLSLYEQFQLLQQQKALSQGTQPYYDQPSAEDTEWFQQLDEDQELMAANKVSRLTVDSALASWGLRQVATGGDLQMGRTNSRLNMSGRGLSDIDLKTYLMQKGKTDLTGLHKAASKGDATAIMNIVKKEGWNASLNMPDENGCTPLMYAALADSESSVEMLLNLSVKREQVDAMGRTAVHYAAFFGKAKSLKFLIESGSDWTPRDVYGRTPLHWTPASKNIKCLIALLNYASHVNGDINPKDNEGMMPTHCAAQLGSAKHITLFIEANCNFTDLDIEGKTVLHWTAENKDPSCLHVIVNYYPHLLNKQDDFGQTILHLTAKKGNALLVEQLLNIEGIEIDARDKEDRTPLHLACMEGHSSIVQLLVHFHALDSCIDSLGLTALHYAVQIESVKSVQCLVSSGYATHVPSADERGMTPLILAAESGFNEILKTLLTNLNIVSEINLCDSNGLSALHYASLGGFNESIVTLLQHGSDPNLVDKANNMSPLDIACEKGHQSCIEPLINGGAATDMIGQDGFALLHRIILYEDLEIVGELLKAGCNTEILDSNGRAPLELAVYTGNVEITALLLKFSNANPNAVDSFGQTVLHIAANQGHAGILKLLLVNGGYANNMDATENRYTPLDYAVQNNHSECVKVLEEKGGMTVHAIQTIAAVWIQAAYRQYRAKKLVQRLRREKFAAICIQRNTRGLLQRRKYQTLKKKVKSSIKIQALVRGFLVRRAFKKRLQKHREKEKQHKLIEDFGQMILSLQDIEPIVLESDELLLEKKQEKTEQERLWQEKVEQCLRMRERYQREQQEWEKFRLLERQRRKDKAHREEQARLMDTIRSSQNRRKYFQEKFNYTITVRSCHQAAMIIQRAYRESKEREEKKRREQEAQRRREMSYQIWAARVIQRSWRCYKEWKEFEAKHLCSIITGPVISLQSRQLPLLPPARPYERETITSGATRRHKLHKTYQSGFKIFKPLPSTSQSCTRPSTKAKPVSNSESTDNGAVLSPRIKSMIQNWPWSRQILFSPNETGDDKLPNIVQQHTHRHNNISITTATEPLKLPQLI